MPLPQNQEQQLDFESESFPDDHGGGGGGPTRVTLADGVTGVTLSDGVTPVTLTV